MPADCEEGAGGSSFFPRDRLEPVGLPDGDGMSAEAAPAPFLLVLGLTVPAKSCGFSAWDLETREGGGRTQAGKVFTGNTCGPSGGRAPLPPRPAGVSLWVLVSQEIGFCT